MDATKFRSPAARTPRPSVEVAKHSMWFTGTRRHITWRIGLNEDGTRPVSREVFDDYRGDGARPDGACVDAEGCLWQAIFADASWPEGMLDQINALGGAS